MRNHITECYSLTTCIFGALLPLSLGRCETNLANVLQSWATLHCICCSCCTIFTLDLALLASLAPLASRSRVLPAASAALCWY